MSEKQYYGDKFYIFLNYINFDCHNNVVNISQVATDVIPPSAYELTRQSIRIWRQNICKICYVTDTKTTISHLL